MFFKLIIILMLLIILISLFSGLFFINRDAGASHGTHKGQGQRAVRALTVRIAVSLILFGTLITAYHLGWFAHS